VVQHALFKRGTGRGKKIVSTATDKKTIEYLFESSAYDFFWGSSVDRGCCARSIAHNCAKTHEKDRLSANMQRCVTFNSEGEFAGDRSQRTTKQRFAIGRQRLRYDLNSDA
jgi:hypothetical protein